MSKYNKGEIVTCRVTGIEKYGIFVNIDGDYSGLIHISEISDSFVRDINDYVKIGETIKAQVLEKVDDYCHVKLSIKNVDYRPLKKKRPKIRETVKGFSTLDFYLNEWIDKKYNEKISEKIKKN